MNIPKFKEVSESHLSLLPVDDDKLQSLIVEYEEQITTALKGTLSHRDVIRPRGVLGTHFSVQKKVFSAIHSNTTEVNEIGEWDCVLEQQMLLFTHALHRVALKALNESVPPEKNYSKIYTLPDSFIHPEILLNPEIQSLGNYLKDISIRHQELRTTGMQRSYKTTKNLQSDYATLVRSVHRKLYEYLQKLKNELSDEEYKSIKTACDTLTEVYSKVSIQGVRKFREHLLSTTHNNFLSALHPFRVIYFNRLSAG